MIAFGTGGFHPHSTASFYLYFILIIIITNRKHTFHCCILWCAMIVITTPSPRGWERGLFLLLTARVAIEQLFSPGLLTDGCPEPITHQAHCLLDEAEIGENVIISTKTKLIISFTNLPTVVEASTGARKRKSLPSRSEKRGGPICYGWPRFCAGRRSRQPASLANGNGLFMNSERP